MNITSNLFPKIWRLNKQYFFESLVGVYAIELPDSLLLFEIPTYTSETKDFLTQFNKPIKALLSHGSTGIADGSKWQSELDVEVYLHEADKNYEWLKMKPDVLFDKVPNFGKGLKVIHTPGHSAGSVCLLYEPEGILFSGDTLCADKKGKILEGSHNDDPKQWTQSCRDLLKYEFKHILPFHYEMVMGTGKESLQNLVKDLG